MKKYREHIVLGRWLLAGLLFAVLYFAVVGGLSIYQEATDEPRIVRIAVYKNKLLHDSTSFSVGDNATGFIVDSAYLVVVYLQDEERKLEK